jgi:hypothetical protein
MDDGGIAENGINCRLFECRLCFFKPLFHIELLTHDVQSTSIKWMSKISTLLAGMPLRGLLP